MPSNKKSDLEIGHHTRTLIEQYGNDREQLKYSSFDAQNAKGLGYIPRKNRTMFDVMIKKIKKQSTYYKQSRIDQDREDREKKLAEEEEEKKALEKMISGQTKGFNVARFDSDS